MGVTNPFILDNFYIWFKNNAQVAGPLYDDVRFEPISGERDGKYFLVTLDYTAVRAKWALFSERYGIGDLETLPEFVCDNVRDMIRYVNKLGAELEQGAPGPLITEKNAVADYIASQPDLKGFTDLHRIDAHTYSVFLARENRKEFIHATPTPAYAPPGFQAGQAVQINGFYVMTTGCWFPRTMSLTEESRTKNGEDRNDDAREPLCPPVAESVPGRRF